ncbi:DUF2254 domain-containing protein [Solirubrobacter soli]|uniref:DUF2254 domain-containing protein n=1 Tax=Solirubrobacter soli TaxID=363832 RepID=UPI000404BBCB|nr:DUF2254 domain-containing protein [Solirubrobacter soli]
MSSPDAHHEVRAAGRLFRLRIWLSSAMWVPVLAANFVAVALGIGLPILDEHLGDEASLPLAGTSAQAIFGALAGGMITFTGIVFSAVFVAAQIQTSSYSPRLAARLRRDPVVIAGLALPTATAIYSLFALAALGRQTDQAGRDFVPAATVVCGLLFALITIGAFVALVQRAFESTQIGGILRNLVRRGYAVIEEVHPRADPSGVASPVVDEGATELAHQGRPAVIAAVDRNALMRLARQTGGFVTVVPVVGEYLSPGRPVLRISGGHTAPDPALARRVFVLARQRTIDQDPAFVLRMLVDIAIRALSPAINDPTTAVQSLDRIESLLAELATRHPGPSLVVDTDGTARAVVPAPRWAAYMELGLMEIRRFGADTPQIVRRLNALYDRLLAVATPDERPRIELERRLLGQAVQSAFPDEQERAIVERPDPLGLGGA